MAQGQPSEGKRVADLVLEGGGVKGIGLVGALAGLEAAGYESRRVAGASAGAITAALHVAGYGADELKQVLIELDFKRFLDRGSEDRLPFVGTPVSILKDQGVFEGNAFLEWMREMLAAKGVHSFGDLQCAPDERPDPIYRWALQVVISDLTGRRLLFLPRDADKLGIADPDTLGVAEAVRMSMSIPLFFEPVTLKNPVTGEDHVIVDGGLLSNFPVSVFDVGDTPRWPTFGLLLVEPEPRRPVSDRLPRSLAVRTGVQATIDFGKSLLLTMLEAHDRMYLEQADFVRTIAIPTLGVGTVDFEISEPRKLELFESGRKAAEEFLADFNFEGYVAEFRTGKEHSRREALAQRMRSPSRAAAE
jgi:NTE family protein